MQKPHWHILPKLRGSLSDFIQRNNLEALRPTLTGVVSGNGIGYTDETK
jgi:hypothetical protein